jgi:chromate reductase
VGGEETDMDRPVAILGIAGSLRRESYNRAVLRAAGELLPAGAKLDPFELEGIPLFNQDQETSLPPVVAELKRRVRAADAVLFVTPEYNASVPGVLKNAIDWATRPAGDNSWRGKPAAIAGASVGSFGTVRAQYHLRQIMVGIEMIPLNRPEVTIARAPERFDAKGQLSDETSRKLLRDLLDALVGWTRKLAQP